jgi:elongation factor P--beta-lysine ligase
MKKRVSAFFMPVFEEPTALIAKPPLVLTARAELFQQIRLFFLERKVLEVDTPLIAPASVTDPYLEPIQTSSGYLQTSPEYAMKRLLAKGSGDIYQLCKAFRHEEVGSATVKNSCCWNGIASVLISGI